MKLIVAGVSIKKQQEENVCVECVGYGCVAGYEHSVRNVPTCLSMCV